MKKILLLAFVGMSSLTMTAQTIQNGNFEATMSPIPGFVYTHGTTGWNALINGGPETAAPFQGNQAAKLVVTNDPALNSALGWGDDVIPGIASQTYKGNFTNAAAVQVDFNFKYTKMGVDTGYIQVGIYDTLATGASDDVLLYFDAIEIGTTVANWTPISFTMNAAGMGTPNRMVFLAVSSVHGYFDLDTPTVGSTLWLDGVTTGIASIDEKFATASVFPNPATNVLNIETTEGVQSVVLTTLDGKSVATSTTSVVNVEGLASGMYMYNVVTLTGKVAQGTFVKN